MNFETATTNVKRLYRGLGWPALFMRIRFFTAPYRALEPYVPQEGLIIDLGSGYGIFSNLLGVLSERRTILGLELDQVKISYAGRGVPNVTFRMADIMKTDLPPADCILLVHVLHHLGSYWEQQTLLETCYKKLKEGGRLVICEVDRHPRWKFILAQIADHLLYPGQRIYYRFPEELSTVLKKSFSKVEFYLADRGKPFPHVIFLCIK